MNLVANASFMYHLTKVPHFQFLNLMQHPTTVSIIRSLVEQVRIPPLSGRYKGIYHWRSSHVDYLLSMHFKDAGRATFLQYSFWLQPKGIKYCLLSCLRCQIFWFSSNPSIWYRKTIEFGCFPRRVKVENSRLYTWVATKVDGAMRDALSIFDRIAGRRITTFTYQAVFTDNLNLLDYNYFKVVDRLLTRRPCYDAYHRWHHEEGSGIF